MTPQLPEHNDELLTRLWEDLVYPGLIDFYELKDKVKAFKPPTDTDIARYVSQQFTEGNEVIIDLHTRIGTLQKELTQTELELRSLVIEAISPSCSPSDRKAAEVKLRQLRGNLTANLTAMRLQAENLKLTEVVEFIKEIIESFITTRSSARSQDIAEERAWLKAHNYPVGEKGKISADLHEIYVNRTD